MISKFEKINEKEEPPHTGINFYTYTISNITGSMIV